MKKIVISVITTAVVVTLINGCMFYFAFFVRYETGDTEKANSYLEYFYNAMYGTTDLGFADNDFAFDDCVPDERAAAETADAIFRAVAGRGYNRRDMRPLLVNYDDRNDVWFVRTQNRSRRMLGGTCNILIRRQNAEVVRIWILR
jgi:hypothetical protein